MAAVPSIGRASRVEAGGAAPEADLTRALYEQYANQIFRYCLHQLGSREEAEDAVQSTFLNAFRGIRRGIVPEVESAWLFKIAHNVCLSRRRSTWRRGKIESPADFDLVEEVTAAPTRRADELMGLQDVLEEMPDNQRRAILLREWQGLSYREIAEELELSQSAVETLIFRARRTLAQGLEQPPEPKRKRLARAFDLGNILGGLQSALFGGGAAAVKVAATVAVVSGTTVVATAPVHHRSHQPKQLAPVPAPKQSSSSTAGSSVATVVAASPAGGLRSSAERRGTQGLAAPTSHRRTHPHAPAVVDTPVTPAPPESSAPAPQSTPEPAPSAPPPVEQQAPPSQPAQSAPAATPTEKPKTETKIETRSNGSNGNGGSNENRGSNGDGNEKPRLPIQTVVPVVPVTPTVSPTTTTTEPVAVAKKDKDSENGDGGGDDRQGGSTAPVVGQVQVVPQQVQPAVTSTTVNVTTNANAVQTWTRDGGKSKSDNEDDNG